MPAWTHCGKTFTKPESYVGFVYLITNLKTGKMYIGKKLFTMAGYRQVKGRRKKLRKPSAWQNYWGSNDLLLQDVKVLGKKNFRREILRLCKSKSECTYYETKAIFDADALLKDCYYNYWVMCKIRKPHCTSFRPNEYPDNE